MVSAGGKHWVVRLSGKTAAHERSFAEAERSIRGILIQKKIEARAKELEADLAKQFPVSIDEAELAKITAPAGSASHVAPPPSSR